MSLTLSTSIIVQHFRGGSRTAGTFKVELFVIIVNGLELFVIIVNGWKPSTIITKSSTLDVAAVLDPSLQFVPNCHSISLHDDLLS